jgi:probable HAF family extracellular repeat protein
LTALGTLSDAFGINDLAQIVGTATVSDGSQHAFLYTDGTMVDLNSLIAPNSGLTLSLAYAINNEGQIVGMAYNSSGYEQAFLLTRNYSPLLHVSILSVWLSIRKLGRQDGQLLVRRTPFPP